MEGVPVVPSKLNYVKSFHKLVCDEISRAIEELSERDKEVYPPYQITYTMNGDKFTLPFYVRKDNG